LGDFFFGQFFFNYRRSPNCLWYFDGQRYAVILTKNGLAYILGELNLSTLVRVVQMAYFQTKNPDLGKFWRVLQWKMLVYYTAIWFILRLHVFGIFYGYLVYFFSFWHDAPRKIWQP
jgi:hypothetical protein